MQHTYVFSLCPPDPELLLEQVSRALEKQTELASRERLPGLWRATDYIDRKPKADAAARRKYRRFMRCLGVVNLLLGIVLLVPGLMAPKEAPVLVFTGAVALLAGVGGLFSGFYRQKRDRFLRAAALLLRGSAAVKPGSARVSFSDSGLEAQVSGCDGETVPYSECTRILETADVFLLTFRERALLLRKQDLTGESVESFRTFISEKIPLTLV